MNQGPRPHSDPPGPAEIDPYGTGRLDRGTDVRARSGVPGDVDFGPGVVVAAAAVVVLLVALVLPWTSAGASGWDLVTGVPGESILPRLFVSFALIFGAIGTLASIATRRWAIVFVTAAGSAVSSVTGLWAVWSQNTAGRTGPGVGLVLALVCMVVLAFRWASYAFSRQ